METKLFAACLLACLLDRLARIEISISIIITTYQFMTAIHTCRLHFSFFSLVEESEDSRGDQRWVRGESGVEECEVEM